MVNAVSRQSKVAMTKATNWDEYYKKPKGAANFTRAITRAKLVRTLKEHISGPISVCEMGGANSCILDAICENFEVEEYSVVDTNDYGLSLLPETCGTTKINRSLSDILTLRPRADETFDLVLSIGLIEHFDVAKTKKAVEAHLHACRPEGYILMTFPTPTVLYRMIRGCAEVFGIWKFPDERPLRAEEVITTLETQSDIIHTSINWWIGLTQYYVLVQKHEKADA